jgi:hypothetical protein
MSLAKEIRRDIAVSCFTIIASIVSVSFAAHSCASLPPKQVAVTDAQQVETLLGTVQDTATALCVPSPATHCTATTGIFTDASWHMLNVALQSAFAAQIQLATALKAWTPGPTAVPPSVATVSQQAQAVITALQALPTGSEETKLLAEAQAVVTEINTVATLISQAQASAAAGS